MTPFDRLLAALDSSGVRYVLIGGVAANVHGSGRLTNDIDIVYDRSDDNIGRMAAALAPLEPYLRGAPPGLPFTFDADTIRRGLNFTLTTRAGNVYAFGEVAGGGTYDALVRKALSSPCSAIASAA